MDHPSFFSCSLLRQEFHPDVARFSRTVSIFVELFNDNLVAMDCFHLAIVAADWSPYSYDITESSCVLDHRSGLSNIPDDANDFQLAQVKPLERRQILARAGIDPCTQRHSLSKPGRQQTAREFSAAR